MIYRNHLYCIAYYHYSVQFTTERTPTAADEVNTANYSVSP